MSCKTSQSPLSCEFEGEVKDMTGLDGCGLMIVLGNGTRLQPAEIKDTSFQLKAGQKVKVSYTELKDRMSNCMSGKIARIDCIKEL